MKISLSRWINCKKEFYLDWIIRCLNLNAFSNKSNPESIFRDFKHQLTKNLQTGIAFQRKFIVHSLRFLIKPWNGFENHCRRSIISPLCKFLYSVCFCIFCVWQVKWVKEDPSGSRGISTGGGIHNHTWLLDCLSLRNFKKYYKIIPYFVLCASHAKLLWGESEWQDLNHAITLSVVFLKINRNHQREMGGESGPDSL